LARPGGRPNAETVFFVDDRVGWVAGPSGAILATVTGGR
jgi:hypothetical protein